MAEHVCWDVSSSSAQRGVGTLLPVEAARYSFSEIGRRHRSFRPQPQIVIKILCCVFVLLCV